MRTRRVNSGNSLRKARLAVVLSLLIVPGHASCAQDTAPKAAVKPADKSQSAKAPEFPAQIELLDTNIRFEVDGSSRKEVHAHVKINNELGARQFARLNFDYNRSFEQIEIPLVRITHASGGIADILPSAITDNPNPAVVDAPAYHDVRIKSVRILGLAPGDSLEYRVITNVSHHPLAPDFWLDHSFDRTGVVSHEIFLIDAPTPHLRIQINPDTPPVVEKSGDGDSSRVSYHWELAQDKLKPRTGGEDTEDVALTTFSSWSQFASKIAKTEDSGFATTIYLQADARGGPQYRRGSAESLYQLVSQKIATIDLPLELSISVRRGAEQILESGYGTSEEKARLLSILMTQIAAQPRTVMYPRGRSLETELPRPGLLAGTLLVMSESTKQHLLDPALEVAPFGLIPSELRGRKALNIADSTAVTDDFFTTIPSDLPFPSSQQVNVDATIAASGMLTSKVHYTLRGDNELLLRVAFHQAPKDKWKEVAQLLALSDGFRGQITNITSSDPYATHDPFTVEYEITTPKFVDWSKKPVRIPALLPQLGLPDPPGKPAAGQATANINLGTPLDVQTTLTLHLPPGTTARVPTGTSVERDYATFASQYSAKSSVVTATRRLNFILREVPSGRAADYNAFLRAVQNDEAQEFTLERSESSPPSTPKTKSAEPITPAPPKPAIANP